MKTLNRPFGLNCRMGFLDASGSASPPLIMPAPTNLARTVIRRPDRLHGDAETVIWEI